MQAELSSLYPAHDRARLIAAARLRTSCRSYAGAPDTADFAALSYALGRYQLPGVRMVFCPVAEDFFTGALLATRRITGCRRIAAVIAQDTPRSRVHAGIMGESLVLEATSHGLGTCWVTGSYRRNALAIDLAANEGVLAVIAIGIPAAPLTEPRQRHRKPPEHFCRGDFRTWPEELTDAAALVQCAPSAMNMQPWTLGLGTRGEFILDTADRSLLDAGIALCHAELALETPHTWHYGASPSEPVAWAVAR